MNSNWKKLFALMCLLLTLSSFAGAALADDTTLGSSSSSSSSSNTILSFFGVGTMSCYSQPQTNCDDNPNDGLFNSIGCQVMKSFNGSIVPLYCNIIANPTYLEAVNAAMVLYVIFIGFSFLAGITQVEIGVVAGQVLKVVIVYAFAINADLYFSVVYQAVLGTPEEIVKILLSGSQAAGGTGFTSGTAGGTGTATNFFQYVDQGIYKVFTDVIKPTYNEASGATYDQANLKLIVLALAVWQVMGDNVGGLFMGVVVGWLLTYFSIMVRYLLAQLSLMFLLMLGPLMIPFYLFKQTQEFTLGWIKMMVAFIVQIMLVVAFVLMIQHFFVDFYNLLKNGLAATPMQQTTTSHLVKYGTDSYKIENKPAYSTANAETQLNQALGGDWKTKSPGFIVQLLSMLAIIFCASSFIRKVPELANIITATPRAPQILGGSKGVDLAGQQNGPRAPRASDLIAPSPVKFER